MEVATKLEYVVVQDRASGPDERLALESLFVMIGAQPRTYGAAPARGAAGRRRLPVDRSGVG